MNLSQFSTPDFVTLTPTAITADGTAAFGVYAGISACIVKLTEGGALRAWQKLKLLEGLELPGERALLGCSLANPPWLAIAQPWGTLATHTPPDLQTELRILARVAEILATLHSVGLVHGEVRPGTIGVDHSWTPQLNFLGLEGLESPRELDEWASACDGCQVGQAQSWLDDAYAFGGVIRATTARVGEEAPAELDALADGLQNEDPALRPSLFECMEAICRLADLAPVGSAIPENRFGPYSVTTEAPSADRVFRATEDSTGHAVRLSVLDVTDAPSDIRASIRAYGQAWMTAQHEVLPRAWFGVGMGWVYLATEDTPNESLEARIAREGSFTEDEALFLTAELASAIAALHEAGAPHGSINTSTLAVESREGGPRLRISQVALSAMAAPDAPQKDLQAIGTIHRALTSKEPSDQLLLALSGESASEVAEALHGLRGVKTRGVDAHPLSPDIEANGTSATVELELRATPMELWSFVSNTERLNQAIGLSAVEEVIRVVDGEPVREGRTRQSGLSLTWREYPFEWVAGERFGVVRVYQEGPLRWMRSVVTLSPTETGTRLVHCVEAEARNVLARAAAAIQIGMISKRALERVYRRIDAFLAGELKPMNRVPADAFLELESIPPNVEARIRQLESELIETGVSSEVATTLCDWVRVAPAQELTRIRPIALARHLEVDEEEMITACMTGARLGLLVAGWDLLCPSCRVPSDFAATLSSLATHGNCAACALVYDLDLASSIELVFRPNPEFRDADRGNYCISSPAKAPHVVAQIRIAPHERLSVPVSLAEGNWNLHVRGRKPLRLEARRAGTAPWRLELRLEAPPSDMVISAGGAELVLVNDGNREVRVRLEAVASRADVVTAARAFSHPRFAEVFPSEGLRADVSVHASILAFVAFECVNPDGPDEQDEWARALEITATAHGGALFRVREERALAVFDDPGRAACAALCVAAAYGRASLDVGPASATSADARLEYFGAPVQGAIQTLGWADRCEVVAGKNALSHSEVHRVISDQMLAGKVILSGPCADGAVRLRTVDVA